MKPKNIMFEEAAKAKLKAAWQNTEIDNTKLIDPLPNGAVLADQEKLKHVNTYGFLPQFYVDIAFKCRNCGKEEIWKAEQQKWWYEEAKGHTDSTAVQCRDCRKNKNQ